MVTPARCTLVIAALFVAALFAAACAPVEGPLTVEALVSDPDAEGGAHLDDVELRTVTDLRTGRGADFDVVGGLKMVANLVLEAAQGADTDQEMLEAARGDEGHDMAARMSFDGTRWLAEDSTPRHDGKTGLARRPDLRRLPGVVRQGAESC